MLLAQDKPQLPRVVANPAAAFFAECEPLNKVLEIRTDFDGDGVEDIAYADYDLRGHRGNCPYDIFLRRSDGKYVEVGVIEYRVHLRVIHSKQGGAVIKTYIPSGGGQGGIITYRISKHGLKQLSIEGIGLETNGFRIDHVFGKNPHELPFKVYTNDEFRAMAGT
jgi:hypothetical protein